MKMLLSELRALIVEAMDPMRLLQVDHNVCLLITDDNDQERSRGGMKFVYHGEWDAYEVVEVWATDPRAAVALFGACLVAKKRLLPDTSLSPAAKAIIKRWYSRHKNDGSVLPGPEREIVEDDPAFNSIYTVPKGFESPVPIEEPTKSYDFQNAIRDAHGVGFRAAYDDQQKSGWNRKR